VSQSLSVWLKSFWEKGLEAKEKGSEERNFNPGVLKRWGQGETVGGEKKSGGGPAIRGRVISVQHGRKCQRKKKKPGDWQTGKGEFPKKEGKGATQKPEEFRGKRCSKGGGEGDEPVTQHLSQKPKKRQKNTHQ